MNVDILNGSRSGLFNYSGTTKYNPDFKVVFEVAGNVKEYLTDELITGAESFVNFAVQLFDVDSVKSKYTKLYVNFEKAWGETKLYDGMFYEGDGFGIIKVFIRDVVTDINTLLTTLAHEMVHVKQFCDSRLRKIFRREDDNVIVGCYSWANATYSNQEIEQDYMNMPWEKEAFGMQDHVVQLYNNKLASS